MNIYVVHSVDRTIAKSCGTGQAGINRALAYAIRRNALESYLSMRHGLMPNSWMPLKIMSRSGRQLAVGVSIDAPTTGKHKTASGWRARKQGKPAIEIISIWPSAVFTAKIALEKRYPKTWQRYFNIACL